MNDGPDYGWYLVGAAIGLLAMVSTIAYILV